jgi:hypothetical protein
MKDKIQLFIIKIALSFKTILWVLSQWKYLALSIVIAVIFFEIIYWLFNLNILWIVLSSDSLNIGDKLSFLISPFQSIGNSSGYFSLGLMILLSLTQGISLSVLTFTMRHQQKVDSKLLGESSIIGLLAVIGLGCPACGTSLITPVVAIFVSSSAVAISEQITAFALPIALIVGVYGLYVLGMKTANVKASLALGKPN